MKLRNVMVIVGGVRCTGWKRRNDPFVCVRADDGRQWKLVGYTSEAYAWIVQHLADARFDTRQEAWKTADAHLAAAPMTAQR